MSPLTNGRKRKLSKTKFFKEVSCMWHKNKMLVFSSCSSVQPFGRAVVWRNVLAIIIIFPVRFVFCSANHSGGHWRCLVRLQQRLIGNACHLNMRAIELCVVVGVVFVDCRVYLRAPHKIDSCNLSNGMSSVLIYFYVEVVCWRRRNGRMREINWMWLSIGCHLSALVLSRRPAMTQKCARGVVGATAINSLSAKSESNSARMRHVEWHKIEFGEPENGDADLFVHGTNECLAGNQNV